MQENKQIKNITSLHATGSNGKFIEYGIDKTTNKFYKRTETMNGVNHFSGVDYKKNYNNPGICFPIQEGENEPIFSGILQHKQLYVDLIHNEYRIFNDDKDKNCIYEQGRCLTIINGFPVEKEELKKPVPGMIDIIFNVTPEPPKPKPYKERKDYYLKKFLKNKEGDELGKELLKYWKETDFHPIMKIFKSNIYKKTKGETLNQLEDSLNRYANEIWNQKKTKSEYATHRNKSTQREDPNRRSLFPEDDIEDLRIEDDQDEIMMRVEEKFEYIKALLTIGYSYNDLRDKTYDELVTIFEEEFE